KTESAAASSRSFSSPALHLPRYDYKDNLRHCPRKMIGRGTQQDYRSAASGPLPAAFLCADLARTEHLACGSVREAFCGQLSLHHEPTARTRRRRPQEQSSSQSGSASRRQLRQPLLLLADRSVQHHAEPVDVVQREPIESRRLHPLL